MLYGQCEQSRAEQSRKLAKGVEQTIKRNGRENKQWKQQRKQPQVKKDKIAAAERI